MGISTSCFHRKCKAEPLSEPRHLSSGAVGPTKGVVLSLRQAASYVWACLSMHEGQEWGPTACLKVFTRIWGQLDPGTCLKQAAICGYYLLFLPLSSSGNTTGIIQLWPLLTFSDWEGLHWGLACPWTVTWRSCSNEEGVPPSSVMIREKNQKTESQKGEVSHSNSYRHKIMRLGFWATGSDSGHLLFPLYYTDFFSHYDNRKWASHSQWNRTRVTMSHDTWSGVILETIEWTRNAPPRPKYSREHY